MSSISNRKSNFELLRVISMILIILFHMVYYGGDVNISSYSVSNFVYSLFYSSGKLGVIIFTMITGYFMIDSKIKIKKLLNLEFQVLFYSILCFLIYIIFRIGYVDIYDVFSSFFPNIMCTYWFFTNYFMLYLLIPFINKLVSNLSRREYKKLLVISVVLFIFIPSFAIFRSSFSPFIYLVIYYLIGGYIKLYCNDLKYNNKYLFSGFCLFLTISALFFLIFSKLSLNNEYFSKFVFSFSDLKSVFLFGCSLCLFLLFKQLNINNNKFINLLGSVSFGVYLFHDNFFMREILWGRLLKVNDLVSSNLFLIYSLVIAFGIYMLVLLIDLGRKFIFNRLNINRLSEKIVNVKFLRKFVDIILD